jgi:hypothetical protein
MSEKMTLRGFEWDEKNQSISTKCTDLPYDQPYSTIKKKKSHHGMPITGVAASKIFNKFFDKVTKKLPKTSPLKDINWVEFSKASIFRILSQEGCDYIRFYFAIPDEAENKASLVLEGVTKNGSAVKGQGLIDVIKAQEQDPENPIQIDSSTLGQYEEKGNGGGFTGDSDNIRSMFQLIKDFQSKKGVTDISFSEFMEEAFIPASQLNFQ